MSKSKVSGLSKQILDYMKDKNRPYNVNDIFSNMKLESKSAMIKALEVLICEKKIKEKTYGKQKIFFVNQDLFPDSIHSDLKSIDLQINDLTQELSVLQNQIKEHDEAIGQLSKSLTLEEVKAELAALHKEIPLLKEKLKNMEYKSGNFNPVDKKKLFESKEKCVKEYRRRKRMSNNVIDAILEGYPKSKKQLLEEIAVEEDDVNLKL